MRQYLDHLWKLAAEGSEWEVRLARRGVLDELALEIAWVKEHAVELVSRDGSPTRTRCRVQERPMAANPPVRRPKP
jgi:hypothetical protein